MTGHSHANNRVASEWNHSRILVGNRCAVVSFLSICPKEREREKGSLSQLSDSSGTRSCPAWPTSHSTAARYGFVTLAARLRTNTHIKLLCIHTGRFCIQFEKRKCQCLWTFDYLILVWEGRDGAQAPYSGIGGRLDIFIDENSRTVRILRTFFTCSSNKENLRRYGWRRFYFNWLKKNSLPDGIICEKFRRKKKNSPT